MIAATLLMVVSSALGTFAQKHPIFPSLPPTVLITDNAVCQEESDIYLRNLQNFTLWAYEMWDATAKSSSGVLRGNIFQLGDFEQCLTANAPFPTRYCLATITADIPKSARPKDFISLKHHPNTPILEKLYPTEDKSQQQRNVVKLAWCVPASCSSRDLETFLNNYISDFDSPLKQDNVSFKAQFSDLVCQTEKETWEMNAADISFCLLALILILTVVASTTYDLTHPDDVNEKPPKKTFLTKLFLSFSAKLNYESLSRADESDPALMLLYGMKTVCILLIILDHRFGTFISGPLMNFDYVESEYRSIYACFLFHGDMFVDSFFTLGGLLVTYGLLNQFDKKIINPGFIILMRYIRLTPVYAFVIFYYATMFNYMGSGPMWKVIAGQDSQDCKNNWWTNLLYISNYVNADHMCMTHSWYLPCDFHYFIIGIGICLLIKKQKKLGLATLLLLTVVSIIVPFALTIIHQRPGLMHFYPEFLTGPKIYPDFLLTYSKSHARATPYFVGMFAGYLYYNLKGTNTHVCRIKSYSILLVSIFLVITSLVGGATFYNPYHPYNAIESASYAAFHRPAFALGTIGILYVGSFGHASFIYKVLSWHPWIPLSKLVYCAYLIHMQFQLRSAAVSATPKTFNYFDVITLGISDMVLAFAAALVLYLIAEAPFRRIFKQLLMPQREIHPAETVTNREDVITVGNSDSREVLREGGMVLNRLLDDMNQSQQHLRANGR